MRSQLLTVASDQGSSKEPAVSVSSQTEVISIMKRSEGIYCFLSADYAASTKGAQINNALILMYV